MTIDLETFSKQELQDLNKRVDKALADYDTRQRREAKAEAERLAATYGFSLSDLVGSKANKDGKKNPPKYAHPENPELTFTGRGRKPKWLLEELDKGRSLDDFLIEKQTS
jgi:DNA-binding protein H-NS